MVLIYIALFMTVILSFWGIQIYNYNSKVDRSLMTSFSQQLMLEHQQAVDTAQDPMLLGEVDLDAILGTLYTNDTVVYPTSPLSFLKKCYNTAGASQDCFGASGLYDRTYDENMYQVKNKITADPNIGWIQLVSFVDMSEGSPILQRDLYRAFVNELGYNLQFGLIDSNNSDAFGDYIVRTGVSGVNDRRVSGALLESPSGSIECLDRNEECFVIIADIAPIATVAEADVLVDIGEVNETFRMFGNEYKGVLVTPNSDNALTFAMSDGVNANPQVNLSVTISGYNEKGEMVPSIEDGGVKNGFNSHLLDLEDIVFKDSNGNVVTNADNAYTPGMTVEVTPNFNQSGGAYVTVTATYEGTNVDESDSVQQDSMTFLVFTQHRELPFVCDAADPLSGFDTRDVDGEDYYLIGSQWDSSDTERATSQLSCISQHQKVDVLSAKYLMLTDADFQANPYPWRALGRWIAFSGVFDGGNNSIAHMPTSWEHSRAYGMFRVLRQAEIRNINFATKFKAYMRTRRSNYFGGLALDADSVTIENIKLSTEVNLGNGNCDKDSTTHAGGLFRGSYNKINIDSVEIKSNIVMTCIDPDTANHVAAGGLIARSHTSNVDIKNSKVIDSSIGISGGTHHSRRSFGGLIGWSEGVVNIDNTNVINSHVQSEHWAGGFIGRSTAGQVSISNSSFTGDVRATSHVGGLIGLAQSTVNITNSHSTATISGGYSVAGLVGAANNINITDSYYNGDITATSGDIGGLVGYASMVTVTDSHSQGNIKGIADIGGLVGDAVGVSKMEKSYSTANITGSHTMGGLVGNGSSNLEVKDSYYSGDITATGENVGGLVGLNVKSIEISYATGNIKGTHDTGGLVGENTAVADAEISQSFFEGDVSGGYRVGGLVGRGNNSLAVDSSYAKTDVLGTGYDVGGLVGYNANLIKNSYHEGNVEGHRDTVGGVLGFINHSGVKINNVYHSGGYVKGGKRVGGLVGHGYVDLAISDSYAESDITGYDRDVGGLVGWRVDKIDNSYHNGVVESTGSYSAGGLVGSVEPNMLAINNSFHTGDVSGTHSVGGLVGWGHNNMTIKNSYAKGNINATSHNGYGNSLAGGLVGYRFKDIEKSYFEGNVTGTYNSVGGLGGYTEAVNPTIKKSFFEGQARGRSYIGGLVGRGTNTMIIENVYAKATGLNDRVAIGSEDFIGGLVGRYAKSIYRALVTHKYGNSKDLVMGRDYVGGTIGRVDAVNASIQEVTVEGGVNLLTSLGRNYVGGIVGQGNSSLTIEKCQTRGARGLNFVGGIVGRYAGTIENSYVKSGSVGGKSFSGAEDYIGGIIGQATGTTTITDSAVSSDVYIRGRDFVGGLIGSGSTVNINDSFRQTGTGSATGANVGSIYGRVSSIALNNQSGLCELNNSLIRGNCSLTDANTISTDWDGDIWANRASIFRNLRSRIHEFDITSKFVVYWMQNGESHYDYFSKQNFTNNNLHRVLDLQWRTGTSSLEIKPYWNYAGGDIESPGLVSTTEGVLVKNITLPLFDSSIWDKTVHPPVLIDPDSFLPIQ